MKIKAKFQFMSCSCVDNFVNLNVISEILGPTHPHKTGL